MANVSIPNLPSVSATTDLDILVITNSGETTTSKITRADFLSGVGGGKLVDANLTGAANFYVDGYTPVYTDAASTFQNFNLSTNTSSNIAGSYNMVLGTSSLAYIYGGRDNTIIGGQYNQIYNSGDNSAIVGSYNSFTRAGFTGILGGRDNKVSNSNAQFGAILGGRNNQISSGVYEGILAGRDNNNFGDYGVMLGGYSNSNGAYFGSTWMGENNINSGSYNYFIGGGFTNINNGNYNFLVNCGTPSGSQKLTFASGKNRNIAISSRVSTIQSDDNTILNSDNVLIPTGVSNVAVINNDSYTANTSNVVVVPGMVWTNYSSFNYADDTAAAAGGVQLGQVYHNAGDLRVRIA
jgi:hypothetical protein